MLLVLVSVRGHAADISRIGNWTTGLTHTVGGVPNTDRLLVFVTGLENNGDTDITGVTYGGQAMTEAVEHVTMASGYKARCEIWYLDEAGIQAASGNTFIVTYASGSPSNPMHAAVSFMNVDQTNPIENTAREQSSVGFNPGVDPIEATVNVFEGGMAIAGAVCGNNGNYTWGNGWTEGTDQTSGSTTTMGTAENAATANGTDTASADHSSTINRQVIVVASLAPSLAPIGDTLSYIISGTLGDGNSSIEITSIANPSWRAIWNEDTGGTISEFYTPSSSITNLVNTNAEFGALLQTGMNSGGSRMQREYADATITLYEVSPARIVLRVDGFLESSTYGAVQQYYCVYPRKIVVYSTATPTVNTSALIFNLTSFTTTAIADNHFQFDAGTLESNNTLVTGWTPNPSNIDYEEGSSLQCIVSGSMDTDFSLWTEDSDSQFITQDEYVEVDAANPYGRGLGFPATNSGTFVQYTPYTSIGALKITDDNTSDGSEAQSYAQDFWTPDTLSFTSGGAWNEDGDGFNQREGVYTIDMDSTQILTFDIDGNVYARYRPAFKIRGWWSLNDPDNVTLETTDLVNGTDYNADVKPFSEAHWAEELLWHSTLHGSSAVTNPDVGSGGGVGPGVDFPGGKYGNGARFNTNNEYISFPISGNFDKAKGSLEFWYQPNYDHTDGATHNICGFRFNNNNRFRVVKVNNNRLRFHIRASGSNYRVDIASTDYSWSAGDWVHIRTQWDDSLPSDDLRLFINGEEPPHTHTNDGAYNSANLLTPNDFLIGNETTGGSNEANGVIDEFRVYSGYSQPEQIAVSGDTSDMKEYLADATDNKTLGFNSVDSDNRGEYLYFGSDNKFKGINIDLETSGSGSSPTIAWQYWNGTAWTTLSVSETASGASDFTSDGTTYWSSEPSGWSPYSINGGQDLYYVRAHLASGSYTTSPVETLIKTDILLFQYLGTITQAAQTFDFAGPTAVKLSGFVAEPRDDHVLLQWATAHEIDNAGFHLYRSLSREGPYTRINASLIPGQGYSVRGAQYWYLDDDVKAGVTYYYKLEDVDFRGLGTMHGPVWATPGGDRDSDGMPDPWEEGVGLNPDVDDAYLDYDGDGLTNLEEFLYGLDPWNSDTDGDGVSDGLEVGNGGGRPVGAKDEGGGDGVQILESNASGVTVELVTSGFSSETVVVDGVEYQKVSIPTYSHGHTSTVGSPQVPIKGILLEVPENSRLSLQVLESQEETYSGYLLYPVPLYRAQGGARGSRYLAEQFIIDQGIFSADGFYPDSTVELGNAGYLRNQRVVQLRFYPVQFNPVTGTVKLHKRIRARVRYDGSVRAQLSTGTQITGEPPAFDAPAYKLSISEAGMYRLSYDYLASNAPEVLSEPSLTIKLYNKGQEVALRVEDGSFVEFYALGEDTRYTDTNLYWLTSGGSPGKRMEEVQVDVSSPMRPDSFWHVARFERNEDYWGDIPGDEDTDRWFYQDHIGGLHPYVRHYTLNLSGVRDTEDPATLRASLFGMADLEPHPNHHTRISINGHLIHDAFWDGQREYLIEVGVPQSYLQEGENIVTVEALLDTGAEWDWILPNWFEVGYWRSFDPAGKDELGFTISNPGEYEFQIDGFNSSDIEVFDTSDPLNPKRFVGLEITGSGPYSVTFEDSIATYKAYHALTVQKMKAGPAGIERFESRNLRSPSNGADWIAIVHEGFLDEVQPLVQHRLERGLRVMVVTTVQVYDEFNGGISSPHAIKDFLRYAYEHWQPPAPQYVLLVGDGTYDYRDYYGQGFGNFVPVYLTYTQYAGEVPSDHWYGCIHGDDPISDLHVGRLPARTSQEVRAMVDKILAYETSPPSDEEWQRRVLLVADDDEAGFEGINEACSVSVSSAYLISRKYLREYPDPSVLREELIDGINEGTLVVNYAGHGAEDFWADEGIFGAADVDGLHNGDNGPRYPLVVAMTCLNGYFAEAFDGWDSLAEVLAKSSDKGAVAVIASSGMSTPGEQVLLDGGLFEALFADGTRQLGGIVSCAKWNLLGSMEDAQEAVGTFVLFGDPAMEVKVQTSDSPVSSGSGGGCFIATAAYGSYAEGHVMSLRIFRDQYLLLNGLGRSLVHLYYRYSPRLATSINERDSLRSVARIGLSPLVGISVLFSWIDLPQRWPLLVTMAVIISVLAYMEIVIRRYRNARIS